MGTVVEEALMNPTKNPAADALVLAMGRYVDGDAAAFTQVYNALAPIVRRCHARWSGPNTADDLTQQTFLRVHRARDSYRQGSPVGPWVLSIARHLSIDSLRKRGRSKETLTRMGALPDRGVGPAADRLEVAAAVRSAVADLPAAQRAVIELHKLEERSFAEVADRLGIKESAARVRAHRAYNSLRAALVGLQGAPSPA
jgi:RNA polymerase sigma-70 factor, ECF subfamily